MVLPAHGRALFISDVSTNPARVNMVADLIDLRQRLFMEVTLTTQANLITHLYTPLLHGLSSISTIDSARIGVTNARR